MDFALWTRAAVMLLIERECCVKMGVRAGTRLWLAAGVTYMRCGFHGLSAQVQTVLDKQPYAGRVFVFRGRRRDIAKIQWFDNDGLCLFAKRLI